jgi:hypothetical protein
MLHNLEIQTVLQTDTPTLAIEIETKIKDSIRKIAFCYREGVEILELGTMIAKMEEYELEET